ncbi:MAG: hypothetical protein ABIL25_04560 [candidate division WOR-3 bacterium]
MDPVIPLDTVLLTGFDKNNHTNIITLLEIMPETQTDKVLVTFLAKRSDTFDTTKFTSAFGTWNVTEFATKPDTSFVTELDTDTITAFASVFDAQTDTCR